METEQNRNLSFHFLIRLFCYRQSKLLQQESNREGEIVPPAAVSQSSAAGSILTHTDTHLLYPAPRHLSLRWRKPSSSVFIKSPAPALESKTGLFLVFCEKAKLQHFIFCMFSEVWRRLTWRALILLVLHVETSGTRCSLDEEESWGLLSDSAMHFTLLFTLLSIDLDIMSWPIMKYGLQMSSVQPATKIPKRFNSHRRQRKPVNVWCFCQLSFYRSTNQFFNSI